MLLLLPKLIPLYFTIFLGFLAGRRLKVERESIGALVFYILVPLIMFSGVMKADFTFSTFTLPFVTFAFAACMNFLFLWLSRRVWKDAHANIIACTAGTGNTGYFGLPVAMALFDEPTVAAYILLILGTSIAESSTGFFIAACGKSSVRDSFIKVLKLPLIYAFAIGVVLRLCEVSLPAFMWEFLASVKGAYTLLGMMIVGLGLAGLHRLQPDMKFIGMSFAAKFIVWPVLMLLLVWADRTWLGIYPESIHHALLLLSIVPMAANTVVIATILNIEPEKVATAVFLSYVLAIIYVPLMVTLFVLP